MKKAILGAAGMALFAFVIDKIGIGPLKAMWIGLPVIVVLSTARLFMQTDSWATALCAEGLPTSRLSLAGIRLSSQGAGYISVFGPLLSEPMKIKLLGNSKEDAVATLVDTGTYWLASAIFGIFGCIAAGVLLANHGSKAFTWLGLAAVFMIGLALILRAKPLLPSLVRRYEKRCPRFLRRLADLETAIRDFASRHPDAIRRMFWLDIGCQILLAGEVIAVLLILHIPFHAGTILAIEAGNRGAKMLTGWLPARIGADEGASAALFAVLGLSTGAGLVLALTRRTRDLLACAIGFAWFSWRTAFHSPKKQTQLLTEEATCKA